MQRFLVNGKNAYFVSFSSNNQSSIKTEKKSILFSKYKYYHFREQTAQDRQQKAYNLSVFCLPINTNLNLLNFAREFHSSGESECNLNMALSGFSPNEKIQIRNCSILFTWECKQCRVERLCYRIWLFMELQDTSQYIPSQRGLKFCGTIPVSRMSITICLYFEPLSWPWPSQPSPKI